jgi:hypothetical protein
MRFRSAACLAVLLLIGELHSVLGGNINANSPSMGGRYQLGRGTSDCHLTKVTVSLDSGAFHHCVGETRVAGCCACHEVRFVVELTVVAAQGNEYRSSKT